MRYKIRQNVWKIAIIIGFRHKIPRFWYREMLRDLQVGRLHVVWLTPVHDDAFVSARSSIKTTVVFFMPQPGYLIELTSLRTEAWFGLQYLSDRVHGAEGWIMDFKPHVPQ